MGKMQPVERSVLEMAYERLNYAFHLFDSIVVFFSGGKDSTVCYYLALEVARALGKLPLRVIFFDEEAIPYQTEEYIRRIAQRDDTALEWYCLPVQHRNACSRLSPFWSPWDPDEEELWVRPLPAEGITHLKGFDRGGTPATRMTIPNLNGLLAPPEDYGRVGMIMGIRSQESLIRYRAVTGRKEDNYLIPYAGATSSGNMTKVYPIYDWKTSDVWTAPATFGWDYNRAYDVMEQQGIPQVHQRCSPAYGEEPLIRFHLYKTCFPEIWSKMSERVAGANTAMLYARTELYGFGKNTLKKPEEMTWEQFLLHYIQQFSLETQPIVADNIRSTIRGHYTTTTDPILAEVDHPLTGVSWKRLLNLAMRGDFKHRRTAKMLVYSLYTKTNSPERLWSRYRAALQEEYPDYALHVFSLPAEKNAAAQEALEPSLEKQGEKADHLKNTRGHLARARARARARQETDLSLSRNTSLSALDQERMIS